MHALNTVMSLLQKGRNALIIPKKRTIDDLVSSRNMVSYLILTLIGSGMQTFISNIG
jgi:hypothetical protein